MLTQRTALPVLTTALVVLGLWVLRHFLPALAWAAVLAVGTWPLYRRFCRALPARVQHGVGPPLAFTLIVGIVFVLPLTLFAIAVGREVLALVRWAGTIEQTGLAAPDWIGHLPLGGYVVDWWQG